MMKYPWYDVPVVVAVRRDVGELVGVGAQVVQLGHAQPRERLGPHLQRARAALLQEHDLEVVITDRQDVAVVADVEEDLARPFLRLAGQVGQEAVAVDVVLVGAADRLVALLQLVDHVRRAGHLEEGRQPVVVLHDVVAHRAGLDLARPAHQQRDAERTFPVGVLLAAERRHAAVGPGVAVRAVVGAVHHEGVVGEAQLVEQVEHLAHVLVVVDHRVVVGRLPLPGLAQARLLGVREEVHVSRVQPHEPRLAGLVLALDEVARGGDKFVVAGFHALLGQRAGVLDLLLADLAPARLDRLVVLVGGPGVHHAARSELLLEPRILRVVDHLRLFFGVEVVEVAEELVEAVVGGQHVVQVAQVVLAELARGVALFLEQRRDGDDLLVHAHRRGGDADLRQAGATARSAR